jgi:hypothetical protein
MAVSADYIANLVAQLDAEKANAALALAMCPEREPWCDCDEWECFWCN